jgi:hypothetical protein
MLRELERNSLAEAAAAMGRKPRAPGLPAGGPPIGFCTQTGTSNACYCFRRIAEGFAMLRKEPAFSFAMAALLLLCAPQQAGAAIIDAAAVVRSFSEVAPLGEIPHSDMDEDADVGLSPNANALTGVQEGARFYVVPSGGGVFPSSHTAIVGAGNSFHSFDPPDADPQPGRGRFSFSHGHQYFASGAVTSIDWPLQRPGLQESTNTYGKYEFISDTMGSLHVDWDAELLQEQRFGTTDDNSLSFELLFDGRTVASLFTSDGDASRLDSLEIPVSAGSRHRLEYRTSGTVFLPNWPDILIRGDVEFEFVEGPEPQPLAPIDPPPLPPVPGGFKVFQLDMVVDATPINGPPDFPISFIYAYDPNLTGTSALSPTGGYNSWHPVAYTARFGDGATAALRSGVDGAIRIEQDEDHLPDAFLQFIAYPDQEDLELFGGRTESIGFTLIDADGAMPYRVNGNTITNRNGDLLSDEEIANLTFEDHPIINLTRLPNTAEFANEVDAVRLLAEFGILLPTAKAFSLREIAHAEGDPLPPTDVNAAAGFVFESSVGTGAWFDPAMASGYVFETDGRSRFTAIRMPEGIGDADGMFKVCLDGQICAEIEEGAYWEFLTPALRIEVTGIDPAVDGTDPLAFPTFLKFDQPIVNFTMTPIPEPRSIALMATFIVYGTMCRHRNASARTRSAYF